MEHRLFTEFPAFQAFLQRSLPLWPSQVQQALRLIALNGIVDPLSETAVSAASLGLAGANYRETLIHNGCLSRHRAVLLVLQELLKAGRLPPAEQLELYCPEAITPYASLLQTVPKRAGQRIHARPGRPPTQALPPPGPLRADPAPGLPGSGDLQ